MTTSVNSLSKEDIRALLDLIQQDEDVLNEPVRYEDEIASETLEYGVRKRIEHIRTVLLGMYESAEEGEEFTRWDKSS